MCDSRNFYPCRAAVVNMGLILTLPAPGGLATPIWTVFSETETRIPELSRTHVAWLRVQPEMAVPVDVVVQPGLQVAQRREALPADELSLQHPVRRLVGRVVVRASPASFRLWDSLGRLHPSLCECAR